MLILPTENAIRVAHQLTGSFSSIQTFQTSLSNIPSTVSSSGYPRVPSHRIPAPPHIRIDDQKCPYPHRMQHTDYHLVYGWHCRVECFLRDLHERVRDTTCDITYAYPTHPNCHTNAHRPLAHRLYGTGVVAADVLVYSCT